MRRYQVKTDEGTILADVTLHDNTKVHVEEIVDTSVIVDVEFINRNLFPRSAGKYNGQAIFLTGIYNWELKKVTENGFDALILIPTRK